MSNSTSPVAMGIATAAAVGMVVLMMKRRQEGKVPGSMKAWQLSSYDSDPAAAIDTLTLEENVPTPSEIGPNQILVKVEYASVNPIDWKLFSGGLHGICPVASFPYTPGFDVGGTVQSVGAEVSNLAVGDKVIADIGLVESCTDPAPTPGGPGGAFAQYAAVPAELCVKVNGMDLKTVVGLPLAGLTSYQALFTGVGSTFTGEPLGDAKEGSKVLILGAAGGVGCLAIQMAKKAKCHVTVTASTSKMPNDSSMTKIDFVKSLGADAVIDYQKENWATVLAGQDYDMIFDCVGAMEDLTEHAPKVLKKGGAFVSIANFDPSCKSTDDVRFCIFLIKSNSEELQSLVTMVKDGDLTVPIDSEHKFSEVKEAMKRSIGGRSVGKILIKMDH